MPQPTVLGDLRRAVDAGEIPHRNVKQELRDNLIAKLQAGEPLFPGIVGYDESVIPQVVNAVLSQHNFIVLGLRGQAKTRILRSLVDLLDDEVPVVPECEIHDDPMAPLCRQCRNRLDEAGDDLEIGWLPKTDRFVEKLVPRSEKHLVFFPAFDELGVAMPVAPRDVRQDRPAAVPHDPDSRSWPARNSGRPRRSLRSDSATRRRSA